MFSVEEAQPEMCPHRLMSSTNLASPSGLVFLQEEPMETWYEMKERHHKERMNQVKYLAVMGYTQTQAAKILDVKLTMLNNFIRRNKIHWPVIEQGKRTNETTAKLRSRIQILKAAS